MKKFSICGWWNQPGFKALTAIQGQAAVVTFNNRHLFCGVIVVNGDNSINEEFSVLYDKNGTAKLFGEMKEGNIYFVKCYDRRDDTIEYVAKLNQESLCWEGEFTGSAVGPGTTKFVLTELPEDLFIDNITKQNPQGSLE